MFCLLARKSLEDKLDDTAAISDERARKEKPLPSVPRRPLHQDAGGGGRDKSANKKPFAIIAGCSSGFFSRKKRGGAVSSRKKTSFLLFSMTLTYLHCAGKGKGRRGSSFVFPFSPPPKNVPQFSGSLLRASSAQRLLKFMAPFFIRSFPISFFLDSSFAMMEEKSREAVLGDK